MKNNWWIIKRILILFFSAFAMCTFLLWLSWCIPEAWLSKNIAESEIYINNYEERTWYHVFSERDIVLDSIDFQMLEFLTYDGSLGNISRFQQALYINNYPRFWHGYYVVLRPLLLFFNYTQIRYYNMLFLLLMTGINTLLIYKKLNFKTALAFLLSMSIGRFF